MYYAESAGCENCPVEFQTKMKKTKLNNKIQNYDKVLELKNITKRFSKSTIALDGIDISIGKGEIHALVGENGAGKSTLINIICGFYPFGEYSGSLYYCEKLCRFKNIKDSEKLGIVVIHQELTLIPYMSIEENIFLGNERQRWFVINSGETSKKAQELMKKVGLSENEKTLVLNVGIGKQQLIEIAKALAKHTKLLILDEPTAALNEEDSKKLMNLLCELKNEGISSLLISHKLDEVIKVADKLTIIRDGKTIKTLDKNKNKIDKNEIISAMVGRDLAVFYPQRKHKLKKEPFFEIKDWYVEHHERSKNIVNGINIKINKGEIVGIAGLVGSGRTEFAMSLFGRLYGRSIRGEIYKDGKKLNIKSVKNAIEAGIAYVSEDRKNFGLILDQDVKTNITLPSLSRISKASNVIDLVKEDDIAEYYRKLFSIKTSSIHEKSGNLSGGNQQKLVLSKWIFSEPSLLILDEPTRGIDVGAKYEIYNIINDLAQNGKSILLISSEMSEVIGMSDRIYVMHEGRTVDEIEKADFSEERIMQSIMKCDPGGGKN